jgi:hypothetical protein
MAVRRIGSRCFQISTSSRHACQKFIVLESALWYTSATQKPLHRSVSDTVGEYYVKSTDPKVESLNTLEHQ